MTYDQIVIGGGLSGLASGIRLARFGFKVLILEQHSIPGGLNSYYHRQGRLLETGLHAMTNFAESGDRQAPLNRLFRQLKLSRKSFLTHQQLRSRILFPDQRSLVFSNDPEQLTAEIGRLFPESLDKFLELVKLVKAHDPFVARPFVSARRVLAELLGNEILANMLLWPLMMYGNSLEHDMDFDQFTIMFQAIFLEGFFRPRGDIKDFLDMLVEHFISLGGEIRYRAKVGRFVRSGDQVDSVVLAGGEVLRARDYLSTAGYPATLGFLGQSPDEKNVRRYHGRLSFVEMIYVLPAEARRRVKSDDTIIFYNFEQPFDYCRPRQAVNVNCGVICFPENFRDLPAGKDFQIRITHPANYRIWRGYSSVEYPLKKQEWLRKSEDRVSKIIGNYCQNIVYQDSFTPLTIEKFTSKAEGAVYGSPEKIRDGRTPLNNLFIAGTDQGYLGIVGAMLSGVTMVNHHIFK